VRALGFVCVIALVVGCSGSTSVRPFGGEYDLISVNGRQIPQPYFPGTSVPELLGGRLTVGVDSLVVNLSLQADGSGHAAGGVVSMVVELPYARLGDSLYLPSDTAIFHSPLYLGPPPTPFGAIRGSSVRITLAASRETSMGVESTVHRFAFAPAP